MIGSHAIAVPAVPQYRRGPDLPPVGGLVGGEIELVAHLAAQCIELDPSLVASAVLDPSLVAAAKLQVHLTADVMLCSSLTGEAELEVNLKATIDLLVITDSV